MELSNLSCIPPFLSPNIINLVTLYVCATHTKNFPEKNALSRQISGTNIWICYIYTLGFNTFPKCRKILNFFFTFLSDL
jgi:hypothetical protein